MNGIKRFVPMLHSTQQRFSPGWFVSSLVLVLTLLAGCAPIQPVPADFGGLQMRAALSGVT